MEQCDRDRFLFLGYDVRQVVDVPVGYDVRQEMGIPAAGKLSCSCSRVVSIDQAISPRLMDPFFADEASAPDLPCGLYSCYDSAAAVISRIAAAERRKCGVLLCSLRACDVPQTDQLTRSYYGIDLNGAAQPKADHAILAGYDVATFEYTWISALTNCGIRWQSVIKDFGRNVNGNCLLNSIEAAEAVKGHAEKLIPSHAPFAVWQVQTQ